MLYAKDQESEWDQEARRQWISQNFHISDRRQFPTVSYSAKFYQLKVIVKVFFSHRNIESYIPQIFQEATVECVPAKKEMNQEKRKVWNWELEDSNPRGGKDSLQ